jgi:2-keto-4-pentenoate hydratase
MFIVHAFADASQNSFLLAWELKRAGIPCELHIYQEGGHGFGARETGLPLNSWKERYREWLVAGGFFDKPLVGEYVQKLATALQSPGPLPRFSALYPSATVDDGFAAQKRLVMATRAADQRAGFKGGATTATGQQTLGIRHPLTGVLFRSGQIVSEDQSAIEIASTPDAVVETELGFLISDGVDISYRLTSIEHTKGAIGAVVAAIELPDTYTRRMGGTLGAADALAANMGSARFIIGQKRVSPDDINPDDVQITLRKDGMVLHEVKADIVQGGQWASLMTLINQIVDQGYTLRSGDLIICGALGPVHPVTPGKFQAEFGPLGAIAFELK